MIIAIDGGAGTGKTTIAKMLSEKISYVHLNSGLLYRAVTFVFLKNNLFNKSDSFYKKFLSELKLEVLGEMLNIVMYEKLDITNQLFNNDITDNIKFVSNNYHIRSYVTNLQRFLSLNKNVVCEGRDISSVVFPNAEFKFFLQCDIDERTNRRYQQFLRQNILIDKSELKKMILKRDKNDASREHSPLVRVPESILIDTTHLSVDEVILKMYNNIKGKHVNKRR